MNAIIHGIRDVELAVGDTLLSPKFKEGDSFKQFNIAIANPPPKTGLRVPEDYADTFRVV